MILNVYNVRLRTSTLIWGKGNMIGEAVIKKGGGWDNGWVGRNGEGAGE